MSTVPTGKKPVKRIPRAPKIPSLPDERKAAAARLRKLIRSCLSGKEPGHWWSLYDLDDYAKWAVRTVKYDTAGDGESPTPDEAAYQIRVFSEAKRHLTMFRCLISGLVDTGPSIRWVDGYAALRITGAAEHLGIVVDRFEEELASQCDMSNAEHFERAVRLAVRGLGPPFGPARDGG